MKRPLHESFACAFRGLWIALKTERNVKIHTAAMIAAVGAGIYLGLSAVEWGLVILSIGLVFAIELINTAVEKFGDKMSGGRHDDVIRTCKDISAAATLVAAATALAIGIIILIIPFFQRVF